MERMRCVLAENPTNPRPRICGQAVRSGKFRRLRPLVDNLWPSFAANHSKKHIFERINPEHLPSVDFRVVKSQACSVEHAGHDEHILDGAAFEHPAGMNSPSRGSFRAIIFVNRHVYFPRAYQPCVQAQVDACYTASLGDPSRILSACQRKCNQARGNCISQNLGRRFVSTSANELKLADLPAMPRLFKPFFLSAHLN
jgi:hypothetical protein